MYQGFNDLPDPQKEFQREFVLFFLKLHPGAMEVWRLRRRYRGVHKPYTDRRLKQHWKRNIMPLSEKLQ